MGSLLQDVIGLFSKKKYAPVPYDVNTDGKEDFLILSKKRNSFLNVAAYKPKLQQELISIKNLSNALGSGAFTSLTTTGTSGASTLISGVLNIPDYATGGGAVTSLTTTGTSGVSTLTSGTLNIPNYAESIDNISKVIYVTESNLAAGATLEARIAAYVNTLNYNKEDIFADVWIEYSDALAIIQYGYLYNWFAVDDSRNVANTGWSVPTIANMITLRNYLDPINTTEPAYYTNTAGGKMKETGLTYWNTPNTGADNVALFNGRGSGYRSDSGQFNSVKISATFWSSSVYVAPNISTGQLRFDNNVFYTAANITNTKPAGLSIRLVKDTTTLTNGQTGTYTGNDGKVYRTICIGTQEWLADNLKETKYRNSDAIPEVIPNATWAALSTGARCSYGNAESSFLTLSTTSVISNWSPAIVTNTGSTLTWDVTGDITATSQNVDDPTFDLSLNTGTVDMNVYAISQLTNLTAHSLGLTAIDLSRALLLTVFLADTNLLTTFIAPAGLLDLQLNANSLATLNVSNAVSLDNLKAHSNSLTTLDITNNTILTRLDVPINSLTSLDTSMNTILDHLAVNSNSITTLDLSTNTLLTYLSCGLNSLTALSVSANTLLETLGCANNTITTLDLSTNVNLTLLSCESNSLTLLDLSANVLLETASCEVNSITNLNTTGLTALTILFCVNNALTTIDISTNTALTDFRCNNNSMSPTATNQILADLVANGLNNGTLHYKNNETGQGVTDRATLFSRGWNITDYTT